jgi:methylated-DNA-[protein]-cysteine S-methyltransferase
MLHVDCVTTPIGPLTLGEHDGRVCLLHFGAKAADARAALQRWYPGEPLADAEITSLRTALRRYFDGHLGVIDQIEVELNGTTFQKQVWSALRSIPAGTTLSYGELARRLGHTQAVRAVGAANGANPVALIVPCHRVIGSNGSLTGYGGGLDRKRWLLAHEGVTTASLF